MKIYFALVLSVALAVGHGYGNSAPENRMETLLPSSDSISGWTLSETIKTYSSDNLYEYIDGEAEMYLAYGFKQLVSAVYVSNGPEGPNFTADIYDMGSLLNAFGLYSSYRYTDYTFESIGAEAMVSDYDIKFYQGRYFVHVTLSDNAEPILQAGHKAAVWIAQRISEPAKPPRELALLPIEGQIDKTIKYTAREMLSQAFLPGGLEAKYKAGGVEATGFVIIFKTAEDAAKGAESLKSFYVKSGEPVDQLAKHPNGFSANTDYHGLVMVSCVGRFMAGIQDMTDANQAVALLNQIAANLKNK